MGEQWVLTLAEARALRRGLGPVLRAARILDGAGLPVHFILPMGGAPRLVQGAVGEDAKSRITADLKLDASDLLRATQDSMAMFAERVGEVGAAPVLSTRLHRAVRDCFAAPISAEDFDMKITPDGEEVGEGDAPLIVIEDEIPAGPSGCASGLDGGAGDGVLAVAAAQTVGPETGAGDAPTPAPVTGEAGTVEGGGCDV